MEKICEFCGAPRPVVYCEADAAFLCLSCDAKVHSANALSGRHSRTLVCDLCRETPAHVRCLDHLMLMCRGCEIRLHQSFPLHRKHIMSSFTGCPSSKHFAALWGFGGGDHSGRGSSLIGSEPCVAKDLNGVKLRSLGSCTQHKTLMNHREEQKGNLIKQQIVELEKLEIQLSEGNNNRSSLSNRRVNPITSSSTYTASGKLDEGLGIRHSKEVKFCIGNHLQSLENPSQESKGERFPSSISQLDQLSCSSSVGDPFWQYKSPVDNSQFWSQNLQDLGVCEDLGSLDDLNIPDVDVTFRNFDDLFTTDLDLTRALLEDDDMSFSDIQRGNRHSKTTEDSSSISMSKDMNSKNKGSTSDHHHHHHMMRFASFSRSRLSAESSGSECVDSGHSVPICTPQVQGKEALHKDRNKTRMHGKQAQLAPRKAKGEMNKRIKGRSMSFGGYDSDTMNITNSY